MNVLEKILEEIEERMNMVENIPVDEDDDFLDGEECYEAGRVQGRYEELVWCRGMIRSHMDDIPNNNSGWIPVGERLPEVGKMVKVTVHSSEWIGDYYSYWVPEEEKTYHPEERNVYDGYIDRVGMWKFCDDGGSVYACDKEFGTDKEIVYDVVTAWMPKEQIEPYKEK